MTMPAMDSDRSSDRSVDPAQLWPGGIATAVVAALVALLGVLAFRWLFDVPDPRPGRAQAHMATQNDGPGFCRRRRGSDCDGAPAPPAAHHAAAAGLLWVDYRPGHAGRRPVPVRHPRPAVAEVCHSDSEPVHRYRHRRAAHRRWCAIRQVWLRVRAPAVGVARSCDGRSRGSRAISGHGARELGAGCHADLPEHLPQVVVDGGGAEEQLRGDVPVALALADQPGDLRLLRRELLFGLGGPLAGAFPGGQQLDRGPVRRTPRRPSR